MIQNNMKNLRTKKKLSMKELSMKTGISERYLYFIERGEKTPSIGTANLIARELDSSIDNIFFAR